MIKKLAVLAVFIGMFIYAPPGHPAFAQTTNNFWPDTPTSYGTVYVRSSLGTGWAPYVLNAVGYVGTFTGSHFVASKCRTDSRCVTVKFGKPPGGALGWTQCKTGNCTIILDKRANTKYRNRILIHEFGHVFGLGHNKHCVSVMWPYRSCSGKNWPGYFSTSEKQTLRGR